MKKTKKKATPAALGIRLSADLTAPTFQCPVCDAKLHQKDGSAVDYKGSGFCRRCGTPTYRMVCNACLPHIVAGWEALHVLAPKKTARDKAD